MDGRMTVYSLKAPPRLWDEVDRVRKLTPREQTRAEWIRDAIASYLNYYDEVLTPTLEQHRQDLEFLENATEFFSGGGARDSDRWV